MSKANGNGRLIPAVGYLRCSTDKQETSVQDQQKAIERYAAEHHYNVHRWYTDDGISGDATSKRSDFQRMIADAQGKADFKAILCWDQDRFGRFDSLEAGHWIYPLRQVGVKLVTLNEGPIDWEDFTGRLMYSIKQEGKHQFLRDLSRNVARGHLEAARNGSWLGSPPYAYRVEGPKKEKRLVLDDRDAVQVVQRIFREFVIEGRSLSEIARRLESDGIPSPGGHGKRWRFDTVRTVLENPAYTGDYVAFRWSFGKYNQVRAGEVVKSEGRSRNPECDWIVRRDHHPAIIDRDTFAQAEAILVSGKTGRSPYSPEENPYVLTGLLRCGKCGSPLYGMRRPKGDTQYYRCGETCYNGFESCEGTSVREDTVLKSIADHLEAWLGLDGEALGTAAYYGALTPADLPEAFAELRKLLTPPATPRQDGVRLAKEAEQLKARIGKVRDNMVEFDREEIQVARDRIRNLERQLADVEGELRKGRLPAEQDVNAVVLEVLHVLYALAYCCRALARPAEEREMRRGSLESAAPQAVRRFLRRVHSVVIHTARNGRGTGVRHRFEKGEIVLMPVGAKPGNLNPHLSV